MTDRTNCVVIGGGPAGMVLGLLLARAGVVVTVLEKHGDFLRDFRGDTVHPTTLNLLDELGLGERFAALPQSKLTQIAFPTADGLLVIGDLNRLKITHPYVAMVPQWDLLNLLAEAGKAEPAFTLMMSTEVTDLIKDEDGVRGVRYRTADGKTGELTANLTVAADGRWSLAREQTGLRPKEFPVPMDAWWFRLPRPESGGPQTLSPAMRDNQFGIVIPREGYYQIAYLAKKGGDAQLRAEGIGAFRKRIAALLPQLTGVVDTLTTMDDVKHLDIRLNRLDRWHTKGLLCIGDAAHAMSPIGGVGINLAVQDAVAAARLLAGPLRYGRHGTELVDERELAKVQRRRLPATVLVQSLQRFLHRQMVVPVITGKRGGPPRPLLTLMRRIPQASYLPARLIGVGFRPESAPGFAKRPVEPVTRSAPGS